MSLVQLIMQELLLDLGLSFIIMPGFLELNLNRVSVLNDTFEQLAAAHQKDYKGFLMVNKPSCFRFYGHGAFKHS